MGKTNCGHLWIGLLLIGMNAVAQRKTWITYEVGYVSNSQQWTSTVDLDVLNSGTSTVGFYIEQELHKNVSVEVGVAENFYGFDANVIKGTDSLTISSYASYTQFPLRVKGRFNLLRNRFFVVPALGLAYSSRDYTGHRIYPTNHYNYFYIDPNNAGYTFQVAHDYPKNLLFLQSGITLEYTAKWWRVGLSASYSYLGKDLLQLSVNDLNTDLYSNGNYAAYQLRSSFCVSELYNKISSKLKARKARKKDKTSQE